MISKLWSALSKQNQRVSENAQAIQTTGPVTVHNGISPEQMSQIMASLMVQASRFTEEARGIVDQRVSEFREEIMQKFAEENEADSNAFKEPDFQYMLGNAQEAYARSGDAAVKETLVDIIARRSKVKTATREALALNAAATRAPYLTNAEFAALSLCYLVKYAHNRSANSVDRFQKYVKETLMPFVDDVSLEQSSIWHLETQSCAKSVIGAPLDEIWAEAYGGVLGLGVSKEDAEKHLGVDQRNLFSQIYKPCLRDETKFQPNALNLKVFKDEFSKIGLSKNKLEYIWKMYSWTIPKGGKLFDMLSLSIPDIYRLLDAWQKSGINTLELNSAGIAIAHANALRMTDFDAPLDVWIR